MKTKLTKKQIIDLIGEDKARKIYPDEFIDYEKFNTTSFVLSNVARPMIWGGHNRFVLSDEYSWEIVQECGISFLEFDK